MSELRRLALQLRVYKRVKAHTCIPHPVNPCVMPAIHRTGDHTSRCRIRRMMMIILRV
jgi:hypothetical protein